ncbi:MAG: fumarylacetoacetate hydrolase family protein [Alphaproteobacteria bacterium]|nr:fumarylacetoacetate hydrolase family protein [Alphaproteobacteria bacterium]MDX5415752.1 fumarylacetoacetate hydrolase family protein [Alphaproteobacteria bacterium]MDX5493019.1 fumarylacetoacetate hydrolase family protein [Alphaproteobacteria bacterium]
MKLATFEYKGGTRLGVVKDAGVVDLSAAAPSLPRDMAALISSDKAMEEARAAAAKGDTLPLADVHLCAPVPFPGKVLAIGLNYRDHVEESGQPMPEHQVWFNKQHNCITGPYDDVALPAVSSLLDYEAEMCFVIGKRCKQVPKERAHEVIAGYFVGNDVSVRDWQLRTNTWQIGKSFDTHGPIGPWIVTPDEVGDPHALDIKCWVNGELRQNSNTKHLIFNCFDQIAHLSQAFTLDPGDVIFTGTSGGVGAAMKPMQFLKAGDVVRVEVEKLGYIENRVVPEKAETIIG